MARSLKFTRIGLMILMTLPVCIFTPKLHKSRNYVTRIVVFDWLFHALGDEALLQQLCYMATGIKQLFIGPDGGTFKLGSGDASIEFPPGAVLKETPVRYAIILHGPFVFPAGYKPGSVIVYLNIRGASLKKTPVLLYLSYWSIKEEGDEEGTLKFLRAPHTLKAGQQKYAFEEQEAKDTDFTTHASLGVLKIWEPQCLYCVEAKEEKMAKYNAVTFSQYIPSQETLLFRIQLMCDSLEWNKVRTYLHT